MRACGILTLVQKENLMLHLHRHSCNLTVDATKSSSKIAGEVVAIRELDRDQAISFINDAKDVEGKRHAAGTEPLGTVLLDFWISGCLDVWISRKTIMKVPSSGVGISLGDRNKSRRYGIAWFLTPPKYLRETWLKKVFRF